jgi:hypothetical protein
MALADLLARCPRCRRTVLLCYGEASYRNLAVFEAVPWSPLDEPAPEGLTENAHKTWLRQLPYRLAVAYIDLVRGTWQLAMVRSNDKLRQGQALWRPHNCLEEVTDDSRVESPATFAPQDRPAVRTREDVATVDERQPARAAEDPRVRRRRNPALRAHSEGV